MNAEVRNGTTSSVRLEKITEPLFPKLYDAFLKDDDPLSDENAWRNVFNYCWEKEPDHCGYALLAGDQVVGMIGMIFSERQINGQSEKFCNLHTWWVREDHRGRSLALLRGVLGLQGYTVTHFTPCDTIRAVTKRMGFQELSSQLKILLPRPGIVGRADLPGASTFEIDQVRPRLSACQAKILDDHRPYGCGHLWIDAGAAGCYVLYTRVVRHRLPYCHVHYISNRDLFQTYEPAVRAALVRRHAVRFVAVDARLTEGMDFPWSFPFWSPANAVYKSDRLLPGQIDHLYSDVVLLSLTTLPDLSHELKQLARRLRPSTRA